MREGRKWQQMDSKVEHYGNHGDVHVARYYLLLLLLMMVVVVVAAGVTESQQAIVRVTPADGMQPFTMQSKEERKKKSMGERNNKKRREADYNHK